MNRLRQRLVFGVLSLTLGLGLTGTGEEIAVMTQPVRVAAPTDMTFRRLQENQILPCFDIQDDSYGVVAPDAQGHLRLARLPRRDAWGRATARAWIFDSSLASNTVKILVPMPLAPGIAFFPAGSRHAVVDSDTHTLDLRYQFAGFEGVFTLPRAAAEIEIPPPPVTDPDRVKEQALQATLRAAVEQQQVLEAALQQAQEDAARIQALRRNVMLAQIESRRLRTELQETQHGVQQALNAEPEDDPALALRQGDLDLRLRERAAAWLEQVENTLHADALGAVEKHLAGVERDVRRVEKSAAVQQAELKALRTAATDDHIRQDADDAAHLVRLALAQQKKVAEDIAQVEAVTQRLTPWFETLAALATENETLRGQLETLQADLAAAREAAAQVTP